jgi:translation initiation factor 6 (eIF-6)
MTEAEVNPNAINMSVAWGNVIVTNDQAAAIFDKLAEMMQDGAPELSAEFNRAAEELRSGK